MNNTPIVILCGGQGILINETDGIVPKAMVKVKGEQLLTHILRHYSNYGFNNFFIATGLNGSKLEKEFYQQDSISKQEGEKVALDGRSLDVRFFDTGEHALTGSRICALRSCLEKYENFGVTYGDVLSLVPLDQYYKDFIKSQKIASLLAVKIPVRFKVLGLKPGDDLVYGFVSPPIIQNDYVIGGFYFFNKQVFAIAHNFLRDDFALEDKLLTELVSSHNLIAWRYNGDWKNFDCNRDISMLDGIAEKIIGE